MLINRIEYRRNLLIINQISYYIQENQSYKLLYLSTWTIILGILLGFFIPLSQSNLAFASHCTSDEYTKYIVDAVGVDWHICLPRRAIVNPPIDTGPIMVNPSVIENLANSPCGTCSETSIIGDTIVMMDNNSITILKDDKIIYKSLRLKDTEVILSDNILSIIQVDNADRNAITGPSLNIQQDIENNSLTIRQGENIVFQNINIDLR